MFSYVSMWFKIFRTLMIPMFQYPIFLDFIIPKSYQYVFAGNYDYDEYYFNPPNSNFRLISLWAITIFLLSA